ncbi:MAG: DUF87 domain-containing protein [Candidatus Aenigmarchaeota archaeon]|nr:DUF87 domain-containing protein [Candidatus Aenigmarchaeota archaeon]
MSENANVQDSREYGTVISTMEGPSTKKFSFVIQGEGVRRGQFVELKTDEGRLIGRVTDIFKANRYFNRPESVKEYESSGKGMGDIFPVTDWEYLVADVEPLGVLGVKGFRDVLFPPSPGERVKEPDKKMLEDFFGIDKKGLNLGKFLNNNLAVKVNPTKLLQKHLAILALSGAGKCLSPKSKVMLENGSMVTFQKLAEKAFSGKIKTEGGVEYADLGVDVLSMEDFRLKAKKAKAITRREAPGKMLKIRTFSGKEITVTKEHPMFTWEDSPQWVDASKLKKGSYLATPSRIRNAGSFQEVNLAKELKDSKDFYAKGVKDLILKVRDSLGTDWKGLSKIAGVKYTTFIGWKKSGKIPLYFLHRLGELCNMDTLETVNNVSYKQSGSIGNIVKVDESFARFLGYLFAEGHNSGNYLTFTNKEECIQRDFERLAVMIGKKPVRTTEIEVRIFWKTLAKILDRVFLLKHTARKKEIPDVILKSPTSVVREYLRVLFDCDGYCSNEKPELELVVSNGINAEKISNMLLMFGIVAFVKTKSMRVGDGIRDYHRIYVRSSDNLRKFSEIGFLIDYKRKRLEKFASMKSNTNVDIFPSTRMLKDVFGDLRLSFSEVGRRGGFAASNLTLFFSRKGCLSRNMARNIIAVLKSRVEEIESLETELPSIGDMLPEKLDSMLSKSRELQKNLGLNYKQIAQNCRVSSATVGRMLGGRTNVTDNVHYILEGMNPSYSDHYPKGVILEKVNEIRKGLLLDFCNLDNLSGLYKGASSDMFVRNQRITYQNLKKCLFGVRNFIEGISLQEVKERVEFLESIVDGDVFWDRILEIEEVKPDFGYVYDLVVEGSHNFVSNGVIVHNSYLTGILIEELLSRKEGEGLGIVIIDPHGEYTSFADDPGFSGKARVFTARDVRIGLPNLSHNNFMEFVPKLSAVQARQISKTMIEMKKSSRSYGIGDVISRVEADEGIKATTKDVILSTLYGLSETGVFGVADYPPLDEMVRQGGVTIVDLSETTNMKKKQIITSYLARKLFNFRRRGLIPPFLLVVEEAHQFVPEGSAREEAISRGVLSTIAREGRKFHASLCLISQRPKRLSTTILSQCNTNIILRLTNPYDLKHVEETSEGITRDVVRQISSLRVGTGLLVGEAVNFPLFLDIRKRKSRESEKGMPLEQAAKEYFEKAQQKSKDAKSFM